METEFALDKSIGHPRNCFGKPLRVICVPRFMLENDIRGSCDGLEARIIAKDLLYKYESWLKANGHRGFSCKWRLQGYEKRRKLTKTTLARFKEFMRENDLHIEPDDGGP